VKITGRTQLFGLIGDPVAHSLSPFILNLAFRTSGIDAVYVAFRVEIGHLTEACRGLRALGAAGINVTYPHKEAVVPLIDRPSPRVALLEAANTLVFSPTGIAGYNTDTSGMVDALRILSDLSIDGREVVIFGAGGAARAAALGLIRAGSAQVTFLVRNPAKAEKDLQRLRAAFLRHPISIRDAFSPETRIEREAALERADVLINATPIGMDTDPESECALIEGPNQVHARQVCMDLVYHPRETPFLRLARNRGARCIDGLTLLVAQARDAFHRWTGETFDLREMTSAVEDHLRREA